ncbi:S-adenosyl-L-methionine-dependent methyltransferase, partial [Gloeopeniophorella convolvens]
RLDAMHNGIKTYLDGKFFLAPLDKPQTILDVGCDSVSRRAIEAAEKFPEASVIGVDISPMPPRPTPSNFEFRQLNILEASPWEAGTFDVVHVRFLFIHLPKPQQIVPQIVQLVKPGGWLLLEEVSLLDSFEGDAQGVRTAFESLRKYWESNNQTPATGTQLESWLNQTGAFSEVNVHEAVAPIGAVTAGA